MTSAITQKHDQQQNVFYIA